MFLRIILRVAVLFYLVTGVIGRDGNILNNKKPRLAPVGSVDLFPRQNVFPNIESFTSMFPAVTSSFACSTSRTRTTSSTTSKSTSTRATSSITTPSRTSTRSSSRSSSSRTSSTRSSSRSTSRTSTTSSSASAPEGTTKCHQPLNNNSPSKSNLLKLLDPDASLGQWCSGVFPSGSPLTITFNAQEYFITVSRQDRSSLQFCRTGINAIISSCIQNQDFYGGTYKQGSESYNISDNNYPGSPIVFTTSSTSTKPAPTNPTLTLKSADSTPQATCGLGARTKFFSYPIDVDIRAGVVGLDIVMPVADGIPGSDWNVFFDSNGPTPSTLFTNWQVFANGPIPFGAGDSSTLNKIRWTSPNNVANTRLEFLVNKQNSDRTFHFSVLGDAPCSTDSSPPPTPTPCPSADKDAGGDMKCPLTSTSLLAPRGDCSSLLSKLPNTSDNSLSAANCISGTTGTNSFGQLFCSLAVNANCALILVFGDAAAQKRPQDRDFLAAVINEANSQCFAVCQTEIVEAARIQGSTETNNQNVRACVINAGQGANC